MEISLLTSPFPHVIINDYFNQEEYVANWNEILFLLPKMGNETGRASNEIGVPVKKGFGIFLHEFFNQPRYHSALYRSTRKLFSPEIYDQLSKIDDLYFRMLRLINDDHVLVQAYTNGDYYKEHIDDCIFTSVTLMYNEPKDFVGGDLYFPEFKYRPELKNNSTILFPSAIFHQVEEVRSNSNHPNCIRFSITQMLHCNISTKNNNG